MTAGGAGLIGPRRQNDSTRKESEPGKLAVRLRRLFFGQAAVEGS
jgi:hypothetical protein